MLTNADAQTRESLARALAKRPGVQNVLILDREAWHPSVETFPPEDGMWQVRFVLSDPSETHRLVVPVPVDYLESVSIREAADAIWDRVQAMLASAV